MLQLNFVGDPSLEPSAMGAGVGEQLKLLCGE